MSDDVARTADSRLDEALAAAGASDPRPLCRGHLRRLKLSDPDAYEDAVAYYRGTLLPAIASGETEPLLAWTAYGLRLARAVAEGRTVVVDPTGLAEPYREPTPSGHVVLHLPDAARERALVVRLPEELSPAQRATCDVLVEGRQKASD